MWKSRNLNSAQVPKPGTKTFSNAFLPRSQCIAEYRKGCSRGREKLTRLNERGRELVTHGLVTLFYASQKVCALA